MTRDKLIKIADEAYDGGLVQQYHENQYAQLGDGLAKFIAIELNETYNPKDSGQEQLKTAAMAIDRARCELARVWLALTKEIEV